MSQRPRSVGDQRARGGVEGRLADVSHSEGPAGAKGEMYDSDLRLSDLMEEESSASSSPAPSDESEEEEDPEEEESTASTEASQHSEFEELQMDRPRRSPGYTKKRVRFPADDMLVSVFEIPQRGDSPLLEELEPCDPERLAEEVAAVTLLPPPPLLSKTTDKPQPSSRSINIVARITGMMNYTPPVKTASSTKSASGRIAPNLPKPKPTVTSKQLQPQQRTKKSSTPKSTSSNTKVGMDNYKSKRPVRRRRSADGRLRRRSKSPSLYGSSKHKDRHSDNPVTLRTTVCRIDTLRTTSTSTSTVVAPPSGASGRQAITLDTRRLTLNERIRASRLLPPRMHPSPYRQGSDSGHRSHTFADPSPRGDLRPEPAATTTQVRPESRTRRMYAWQAANGMIRPSQMDTPCIAPLWEHPSKPGNSEHGMGSIT